MDINRKRARGDQEGTEISDLPDNVIDNILDRLPLGDAVRTSILSRKWCHHWTRLGDLVFDETFINDEIVRGKQPRDEAETLCSIYSDAIDTILLRHLGPINKFVLDIPAFFESPTTNAQVNKWLNDVSSNGVKDISLACPTIIGLRPRRLPTDIFHCKELRHLSLRNCKADLPSYFTGFSNLISLHLGSFSTDGDGLNVLVSGCPLLENLCLEFCKGALNISTLRLKTFKAKYCSFDRLTMHNVPNLVTASLTLSSNIYSVQPRNFESFFGLMPNIESIALGASFVHAFDWRHIPKTLPAPLKCLKHLTLGALCVADRVRMLFSFCILRSSPYLQTLNVAFCVLISAKAEGLEAIATFCEEQFSEPYYLKNIITVKMNRFEGTWGQIAFIKFILASCPALEELYVNADRSVSQASDLRILTELNECSRASSKAKIIYSKALRTNFKIAMSYSKGQVHSSIFDF